MSAYEHDDRVAISNDRAVIHDWRVIHQIGLGWCVFLGPYLELIGAGHDSMDAAIESLIGEPAVKA